MLGIGYQESSSYGWERDISRQGQGAGVVQRVGAVAGSDGNGHGVVCISVDSPDEATDGAVERKASNKRRFVSSVVLK